VTVGHFRFAEEGFEGLHGVMILLAVDHDVSRR
jgi:hypothetical protein